MVFVGKEGKLCKIMYNNLLKLHMDNAYTSPCIKHIENLLSECNMQLVWEEQFYGNINNSFKMRVDKKLKDNFIEKWRMEINDTSQCYLYKYCKTDFKFENYLVQLIRGRYRNIAREQRICNICNTGRRGDAYHIFFECQNDVNEMCL